MPGMLMITAVIGWLFLVVELLVAAPVWAVAHAYAEGEGFAPQQANYGYGAMIGVLMRPVALVFGFVFMFFIMNIAMWFAAVAMALFLSTMITSSSIGFGTMLGAMSVIVATAFMVVKYVMQMITHLPDNLPNWMGGRGTNTGDLAAAQQGQSQAEGLSGKMTGAVQQGLSNAYTYGRMNQGSNNTPGGSQPSGGINAQNPGGSGERELKAEESAIEKEIKDDK